MNKNNQNLSSASVASDSPNQSNETRETKFPCANCGQWLRFTNKGYFDCINDCAERNLADRISQDGQTQVYAT